MAPHFEHKRDIANGIKSDFFSFFMLFFSEIFFCADTLHRTPVPLQRDSEKPRNGSKVLTNNIHNMGAIFLLLFFANFFKSFGKAMEHSNDTYRQDR